MVHESVIERIRSAQDRYAPIVMPQSYTVVRWDGTLARRPEGSAEAVARAKGQVKVWNDVWRRRVNYFATVGVSFALALLPALDGSLLLDTDALVELHRLAAPFTHLVSPLIRATERFLPGFAQIWLESFATHPALFSVLVVALVGLLLRGGALQRRIDDRMHVLWRPLHGQGGARPKSGWGDECIQALRTSSIYQTTLQFAKWQAVPFVFGALALITLVVIAASPVVLAVYRSKIHAAETDGTICTLAVPDRTLTSTPNNKRVFDIRDLCMDTGIDVTTGKTYRISLTVFEPWSDGTINTTPGGFGPERMTWPLGYLAIPFRRSLDGNWLQTFAAIVPSAERSGYAEPGPQPRFPLDFLPAGPNYVARSEAPASGRVRLWVNDVVVPWQGLLIPWRGLTQACYLKNRGKAAIDIREDDRELAP